MFRGNPLGLADGSALEGYARAISQRNHLLAPVAGMGGSRYLGNRMAGLTRTHGAEAIIAMGGNLCRWQFCPGEKRGEKVGKTKRGKGTKWMVLVERQGIPVGALLASASPAEVKLLEPLVQTVQFPSGPDSWVRPEPHRLIADRAYDSDPLREKMREYGIELIAPNRKKRRRKTADGRKLRRYRRRWIIERTMAWLSNFRRLAVRYDRLITIYSAFFHVACLMIALRHL